MEKVYSIGLIAAFLISLVFNLIQSFLISDLRIDLKNEYFVTEMLQKTVSKLELKLKAYRSSNNLLTNEINKEYDRNGSKKK